MPKNKGIYKIFKTKADFECFRNNIVHFARVYTLDDVTLALGRMGFREAEFRELDKQLSAVSKEYARETLVDARCDKDMWYSRECKDRELKEYTGSLFAPWDERYE